MPMVSYPNNHPELIHMHSCKPNCRGCTTLHNTPPSTTSYSTKTPRCELSCLLVFSQWSTVCTLALSQVCPGHIFPDVDILDRGVFPVNHLVPRPLSQGLLSPPWCSVRRSHAEDCSRMKCRATYETASCRNSGNMRRGVPIKRWCMWQ